ncbi:hypothetical protein, partial [Escherichia coli]|uniref:hypothetical protein n=1 Tax=Escherichia coli TaxID=562 RepID=UPI0028DDD125
KRAYCLKTQPATGETYPKSDLFNKATFQTHRDVISGSLSVLLVYSLQTNCESNQCETERYNLPFFSVNIAQPGGR